MRVEKGVMVMKGDKAWGIVYEDGRETNYGWLDPEDFRASIHDPKYCKSPLDVTYKQSPYRKELSTASIIPVERRTTIIFTSGVL